VDHGGTLPRRAAAFTQSLTPRGDSAAGPDARSSWRHVDWRRPGGVAVRSSSADTEIELTSTKHMPAPATPVVDAPGAQREGRGRPESLIWRRLVAFAFAAATLALARPAESPLWPWGLAAGCFLMVVGEALRIWGCGHLDKNQRVVSSGPYAHVRNPLYLGTLSIVVGVCVAAGSSLVLYLILPLALVVFFGYYAPKKERIESDRMRRRFGARFEEYRSSVPGYLPRLKRWSGASRDRWRAKLLVENTEIPTVLIVAAGLALIVVRAFL